MYVCMHACMYICMYVCILRDTLTVGYCDFLLSIDETSQYEYMRLHNQLHYGNSYIFSDADEQNDSVE